MALIIQGGEEPFNVSAENDDLAKLCTHPMFGDLQATLVTDCFNNSSPFSLCQENVAADAAADPPVDAALAAVEEANLQSQFQQMSNQNSAKVSELQMFYNTQCSKVETERSEAIAALKAKAITNVSQYQYELSEIHASHDRQRIHLTRRVTTSLTLLRTSLPAMADSTTKTKPRQLNARGVAIMTKWWDEHQDNPYPSEEEKDKMAKAGNLSLAQVKAWFANKRNRTSSTKPKKQKQQVEKKLLSICSELTGDCSKAPRMYGDIIKQLSDIVNGSTVFSQNLLPRDLCSKNSTNEAGNLSA